MRILILDDDREDADLVRDLLVDATGEEPDTVWAATFEEGVRRLEEMEVDVCLADYRLGARTGVDFLRDPGVRRSGVPVILLTGRGTAEVDRTAMEAGAVDYLPKEELTAPGLERAIRYAVERRRRQEAEAKVRALLGSVQEIVSVVDADGSLRYVSPSLFRVLGFPADERLGDNALFDVHPEDRPAVTEALGKVLADSSGRAELQYRVRHADGSWRVLDTIAENHVDDPNLRGVVISSRDVTDRVRREAHVRFQASLLDAVGQSVIATDMSGKVIYWNPAAEQFFGWSREEAVGRDVADLNVMPERSGEAAQILESVEAEGHWTGDFEVRRKDGSTFTALVSNSLIRDASGEPAGFIGVASDITPLKETEAALRERVKELRALTGASEILNLPGLSIEERLRRVVELIPSGWLAPEHTEARLTIGENRVIQTEGFRETPWMARVEIRSQGEEGRLEVALTAEPPDGAVDPFLPEEHDLLENLGRILGDAIGRASLQRLVTQAFASIREAVLVIDSREEGRGIRYVNAAAERMFGYDQEELVGATTEKLHPDRESFARFAEEGAPLLEREGVFLGEFPMRRKDGSTFEAEQTVSLLNPGLGLDGGVVKVLRDVSERRAAERRILESEERFRQIAEHIADVFWISSPGKEEVEYVSPAYAQIWGRPPEELLEQPGHWLEAIVPEDRGRVRAAMGRQAKAPYEEEYRIVRPDGEERWILDRSFPVRDDEGRTTRIIGVARDVTEGKRLEERFGLLSQEITDAIYVLSPEGVVRMSSPSIHGVAGYTRLEFEGMSALEVVHPEDRGLVEQKLREAGGEPGDTARAEYRIITKAGEVRHVESVGRNLLRDPAVGGLLITTRDITERTELEHRVRQMQKMESIGQLAGGIAHDFNNILTVIRSQSDLILMELPSGADAEEVRIIQDAADRAATLTGQLLAFSREQVLQPRVVDVAAAMAELGRLIERVIGEDVRVVYEVEDGLPPVRIDPHQLEQVVLNLTLNARDAMPDGGTLTLFALTETLDGTAMESMPGIEPGDYVTLGVSDTGTGMSEEVRRKVFEPFFTTKAKGKGTGLGLAMVYGTVKQSGGSVHVESEPGVGTTFHLRFPPVEATEDEVYAPSSKSPSWAATDALATGDVLVVEDDPAVRRAIGKVLGRAGFTVHVVEDAEAGLELLDGGGAVDVILSDLVLPGMSGYELVDRLRAEYPDIPLVIMSGYAEGSPGRRDGLPEDVAFVQKPFTPDRLLEVVREALDEA